MYVANMAIPIKKATIDIPTDEVSKTLSAKTRNNVLTIYKATFAPRRQHKKQRKRIIHRYRGNLNLRAKMCFLRAISAKLSMII